MPIKVTSPKTGKKYILRKKKNPKRTTGKYA